MTIAAPRFHGFTRAVAQKLLCFEAKRNLTVRGFLVSIASDKALPISEDSQAGQRCQASSPITSALDLPSIARSEEHTSELQSLMRISYAVFCLKKKKNKTRQTHY